MSSKSSNKPLITKNWLSIETIHGVPNIITSRVRIAQMKKDREAAGKPPSKHLNCQYCGRALMSIQALRGHLKGCTGRKAYLAMKENGWDFQIGSRTFTVRSTRWSWVREAASIEAELNQRIADGTMQEDDAVVRFNWFVLGLQATLPTVDAAVTSPEAAIRAG